MESGVSGSGIVAVKLRNVFGGSYYEGRSNALWRPGQVWPNNKLLNAADRIYPNPTTR
jgi:hypothetical protein